MPSDPHLEPPAPSAAPSPDLLLLFTPHVPLRVNTTGWTPERQIAFIAALARTGVVRAAAASVGMSTRAAYQLRARVRFHTHNIADMPMTPEMAARLGPGYTYSFAAAWDLALDRGIRHQMAAALPVAHDGEEVPVIRRGAIIGWKRKHHIRLMIAACGAFRRYNEGSWYDHEVRMAEGMERFLVKIETLMRLGPIRWLDTPPESPEERRERLRREREELRIYGARSAGLLDPYGPADRPPRTLAQRAAEAAQPPPPPPRDPPRPQGGTS